MNSSTPIGIIDSGVGGTTVWSEIVTLLPGESTIYYADSANCPYGGKSYPQIVALTEICVKNLISREVKMIVIACNTITAASISLLRSRYPTMLFVGMEPAIKPAAALSKSGTVGILATRATLASELYHRTSSRIRPHIQVIETAGDGLVELIEQGDENSPQCEWLTRKYIAPMISQGADCIVLGCTHYPLLTKTIDRISGGKLAIINPAPAVARRVESLLKSNNLLNTTKKEPLHTFISSSGNLSAETARQRALSLVNGYRSTRVESTPITAPPRVALALSLGVPK